VAQLKQPLLSIYANPEHATAASTYPVKNHTPRAIPGSRHYIPLSHPAELRQHLDAWLTDQIN